MFLPRSLFISACVLFVLAGAAQANPVRDKYNEAMNAFKNGEYQKAVGLFEETLKLNPNFAHPYNFIAMAKKELGEDPQQVIDLLKKSVEIDPGFALGHDNLGKMYYGIGKFQLALEHAQKAVELDPKLLTARLSLAWICLLGIGETGQAVEHFEEALKIQRTDYGQFGLGMAYFMDHQRGKVLEMITNLRLEGNEKLATDLEEMVRQGQYLPPKGLQALIAPEAAAQETPAQQASAKDNIQYPVRLSAPLDGPVGIPSGQTYDPNAMTAAQRIRQLQRNYMPQAGY
jgi:tetratricopeptide (TPR) repeat protein